MDKDFEIEIQEDAVDETSSIQLPVNFLTFGEIENDDVKVYIKQDVYKALEKLAASDTEKELGSILLGEYCQLNGKINVVISRYIEAKYTDASASTLTFTHETWDYVHAERGKNYPDLKIVGWQHTHPSYGIFLSNYDMFIQENFFNLPFQVAYVIDPVQGLRGFFQWKDGKVQKLKGYYIYDDVSKPIKIEQTKAKKQETPREKPTKVLPTLFGLLWVFTILVAGCLFSLNSKLEKQLAQQGALMEQLAQQQAELESNRIEMDLQNTFIQNQDKQITSLKDQLSALQQTPEDEPVKFKAYTVAAGDNLYKICTANGLEYASVYKTILAINGIENPNQIYAGQVILLPILN